MQVFVAAAKHLSLTRAANELLISEPAVSQHVKSLETYFGTPLFVRLPRRLALTPEGDKLFCAATESFNLLSAASAALKINSAQRKVRIKVTSHFSTSWVAPRLHNLNINPKAVQLTFVEYSGAMKALDEETDIVVIWGDQIPNGCTSEELFTLNYLPMCSPELLETVSSGDIGKLLTESPVFVHSDSAPWESWLSRANLIDIPLSSPMHFDNYDMLLEVTTQGRGLSLLMYPMFTKHLSDGRLVAPFGTEAGLPLRARICYRKGALGRPEVRTIRDWIVDEAKTWRSRSF